MNEPEIRQEDIFVLNGYRHIYLTYPYGTEPDFPRVDALSREDENILRVVYKNWRGEIVDIKCESCVNEMFDRLMKQMLRQEQKQRA